MLIILIAMGLKGTRDNQSRGYFCHVLEAKLNPTNSYKECFLKGV